jgi:lipoprotein-releasing system ATP-binding protein
VDKLDRSEFVVELKGVCKSFNVGQPNEIEILHNIELELRRGEFCAVMGPSGSGKSTLLNIIGLLDRPTQGLLAINGEETTKLGDHALTRLRGHAIGFVFQHHHLLSAFSALENVMMPMMGSHGFCSPDITARAMSLLESVDQKCRFGFCSFAKSEHRTRHCGLICHPQPRIGRAMRQNTASD